MEKNDVVLNTSLFVVYNVDVLNLNSILLVYFLIMSETSVQYYKPLYKDFYNMTNNCTYLSLYFFLKTFFNAPYDLSF